MNHKAYASLYFLYDAAKRFAALDRSSAQQIVHALSGELQFEAHQTKWIARELIRKINTPKNDLWLGAVAEPEGITIVSLGDQEPDETLLFKIRALTRARKRPALGGVSLEESVDDVQETIRALLDELHVAEPNIFDAQTRRRLSAYPSLVQELTRSARRWRTTQARQEFKEVLHEASLAPQVVERDGQEVLIIERDLLERFEHPLTGAALAARFARNQLPRLVFEEDEETEPEPDVHLRESNEFANESASGTLPLFNPDEGTASSAELGGREEQADEASHTRQQGAAD